MERTETNDDGDEVVIGHCCLGVATHVAIRNGFEHGEGNSVIDWGQSSMDPQVGQWFGFGELAPEREAFQVPWETCDPTLIEADPDLGISQISCTDANDQHEWSFARIADALEARYLTPMNIEQEA